MLELRCLQLHLNFGMFADQWTPEIVETGAGHPGGAAPTAAAGHQGGTDTGIGTATVTVTTTAGIAEVHNSAVFPLLTPQRALRQDIHTHFC